MLPTPRITFPLGADTARRTHHLSTTTATAKVITHFIRALAQILKSTVAKASNAFTAATCHDQLLIPLTRTVMSRRAQPTGDHL